MAPNPGNNLPRSYQQWNAISATAPDFNLDSGIYGLTLTAGVWGTATLKRYVTVSDSYVAVTAALNADGYTVVQLPAGRYSLALSGITTISGMIELIARGGLRG